MAPGHPNGMPHTMSVKSLGRRHSHRLSLLFQDSSRTQDCCIKLHIEKIAQKGLSIRIASLSALTGSLSCALLVLQVTLQWQRSFWTTLSGCMVSRTPHVTV